MIGNCWNMLKNSEEVRLCNKDDPVSYCVYEPRANDVYFVLKFKTSTGQFHNTALSVLVAVGLC